eukprot:m.310998 g.310998  ORF g.310998 m.310998 type:complete len:358 (+) comp20216_c0_seq13:110-1183(+)
MKPIMPVMTLVVVIVSTQGYSLQHIPGADPTGVNDSSAALNRAIRNICNATAMHTESSTLLGVDRVPRDAVLDLGGGIFRLNAPIAVDDTVVCTGVLRIMRGTLLADERLADMGGNNSFLVTVISYWNGLGVSLEQMVFASNGTGGGVRVEAAHHVHIVDSNFLNFATVGIWGSRVTGVSGHELAVDRCRLTECTAGMSACADITQKKATAILLEFPDSHVRNTVITCGLMGIVNRAGSNTFITNHIWTSCTGDAPYGANNTIGFADEAGATRISDSYIDNCDLVLSGYRGTTITNNFFNGGARLVLVCAGAALLSTEFVTGRVRSGPRVLSTQLSVTPSARPENCLVMLTYRCVVN